MYLTKYSTYNKTLNLYIQFINYRLQRKVSNQLSSRINVHSFYSESIYLEKETVKWIKMDFITTKIKTMGKKRNYSYMKIFFNR